MYLRALEIEGYKKFSEKFGIEFQKGLNVLVGENGVGKSAVIDAIRLMFLDEEFGRSPVSDTDFHRPFYEPAAQADSFRLRCQFADLSSTETIAFLPWSDLEGHASLTLVVDNKPNYAGRYKRFLWGGASRSSILERELFDAINCVYLPPLRDAEAKLREGKASRLARLLRKLNKRSLKEAKLNNEPHPLEKKVRDFNAQLSGDDSESISKANSLIRERLVEALGDVFGQDTHIQFSEASFTRIVENLRMLFFPEAKTSESRDMFRSLEENSLGYNNLLYLATVLAELTETTEASEHFRLLLIEEPEAHLHPQLQVRLLKYLEKTATEKKVQVIVTTHSPVLAASVSLGSLVHLCASDNQTPRATALGKCGLTGESAAFVNRWLDVTKSTLLFAKGVILVEGIAEAMLLPVLAKCVLSQYNAALNEGKRLPDSLEDAGVSVINMMGIYFKHFMQLFCNLGDSGFSSIPIRCSGITDNDPPKESTPTPSNPVTGSNLALSLIATINSSEWARLYAGKLKTFEYDLGMEEDNLASMLPVARSLIETDGSIKKTLEDYEKVDWAFEQSEDRKAKTAYYLLNHIDKGEFSQALADCLSSNAGDLAIPQYIRQAVIWACGGRPDES